jgi:polyadenylate-binding protein
VNYKEAEAAAKCVEALNGKELAGKSAPEKTLYVNRAQKKAERSAVLKAKFDEVRAVLHCTAAARGQAG